jgi:hypothetical protein
VARSLVDKLCQREALRKGGVPSPLCWEIPAGRSPAAVEAVAAAVDYPAVLKPRTGSRGQYTTLVADAGDLVGQVALLPPQAGGNAGMFVEQYLPDLAAGPSERFADYLSVESLVALGEVSHVAVTGRFPLAEPFRETGFFIPADMPLAIGRREDAWPFICSVFGVSADYEELLEINRFLHEEVSIVYE